MLQKVIMWKKIILSFAFIYLMMGNGALVYAAPIKIENPINSTDIIALITSVSAKIFDVAIVIAVVSIIIVGFKYIVSAVQGNATGIKDANKMLFWLVIGLAVVVGARVIATAVQTFLRGL